jgi:hypothetical protein
VPLWCTVRLMGGVDYSKWRFTTWRDQMGDLDPETRGEIGGQVPHLIPD